MRNEHILFAIVLVVSIQLPSVYGSALFLLSIILFASSSSFNAKSNSLSLSPFYAIMASLFVLAHHLGNIRSHQLPPDVIAVLHGSIYLVLLVSLRGRVRLAMPEKTIAFITAINLIMLVASPIPFIQEIAFVEKVNGIRFKSYFSEPAAAAITYCVHILLMSKAQSKYLKYFVYAASALMILFTFSGSGLVLLAVVLLQRETLRWLLPVGVGVLAATLFFGFVLPSQVDSIVLSRVDRILSNDLSNSSFLRFVAPWMVLQDAFQDLRTATTGVGIGNLSEYILANWSTFHYLRDFAGSRVLVLNNGYSIILLLLGIPAGLAFFIFLARRLISSPTDTRMKIFFILLPFFTGVLWSSAFWFSFLMAAGVLSFSQSKFEGRSSKQAGKTGTERRARVLESVAT